MRRNWYDIKAAAGTKLAVISIYDEIGMWGITAKDFITNFRAIEGNDVILEINTPGGSIFDGLAMFNAMKNSGKNITVKVMGIAASMGSYLAMVGGKTIMPENTFMMVHSPLTGMYGNAEDLREMADVLDKIGATLSNTYVARSGQTPEVIADLLSKDTYLTAAECLELGLCDEVTPAVEATAKFEAEHLPENIRALFTPKATQEPTEDHVDPVTDPVPEATFAEQLTAAAEKAGMPFMAAVWALDQRIENMDHVTARVAEAREITAICALATKPEMADALIRIGATVTDARTKVSEALAAKDDKTNVDTTQPSSNKPINGAQPSAVKTADIWAAHRSKSRSK